MATGATTGTTQRKSAEPAQRPRRPKDRRARIARAGAQMFARYGYHNVGIDEIAAEVGITGPAVYRHFSGKQDILAHVSRELANAVREAVAAASGPGSPDERLDGIIRELARFAVERRSVGALYQWEGRHLDPSVREELHDQLREVIRTLSGLLRECRPDLAADDAELLVIATLSALASVCTHRVQVAQRRAQRLLCQVARALLHSQPPPPEPADQASRPRQQGPPAARREALLNAAARLFREAGYHAVSIDDIGSAVGINGSSVYRHFPSKGDLLAAIYYRAADRLAVATTAALNEATAERAALEDLAETFTDLTFACGDLVSVYLSEQHNLPSEARHELRRAQRIHVDEWVRLLVVGHEGLRPSDASIIVHAALNLIIDLARLANYDRAGAADRRTTYLALAALRSLD